MELIEYSKCSTCKKAKQFLIDNNINFEVRQIKENTPTSDEINNWIKKYNININKLFNTSGLVYKELKLKEKINTISENEKLNLLSSNGMLIKRPLLINNNYILIGFKENEWKEKLL